MIFGSIGIQWCINSIQKWKTCLLRVKYGALEFYNFYIVSFKNQNFLSTLQFLHHLFNTFPWSTSCNSFITRERTSQLEACLMIRWEVVGGCKRGVSNSTLRGNLQKREMETRFSREKNFCYMNKKQKEKRGGKLKNMD